MSRGDEEAKYERLVFELEDELSRPHPDERIREIARQEADRRFGSWIVLAATIAAIYFWGWIGLVGLIILWPMSRESTPRADRHLIVRNAEDYIRLKITAETFAAGETCWRVEEDNLDDTRRVLACDSPRWDNAWQRIYHTAQEFRHISARERRKRLRAAAREAKAALDLARDLAKKEKAEPVHWAQNGMWLIRD